MSIEVKNLSKTYSKQLAVDNISFYVKKGEIVGFLGPNGAGKSSVMKILTNFIKDFEGEAFINEISIRENPILTQKSIGYLPENNPLYIEMYVREYLDFHADLYQVSKLKIDEIIDEVGLKSHVHKFIHELSKGYRQRVGLAAALLHDPEVLILDEPTTGLDPNQLVEIRDLIKKVGKEKTVLFSTHILQEVEAVCDRVIILKEGKIVANERLDQLKNQTHQVIEVEFDVKLNAEAFEIIPNLKSVNQINDNLWELVFVEKNDMRASIFDFAQAKGIKILNLYRKNLSLEQMFKDLTT